MKKPAQYFIIIVFISFGVGLGLFWLLPKPEAPKDIQAVVSNPVVKQEPTITPKKAKEKKTLNEVDSLWKELNRMSLENVVEANNACEKEFRAHFPNDDFLDPQSDIFSTNDKIVVALDVANSLTNRIEASTEYFNYIDVVLDDERFNPIEIHELHAKGIVCNEVSYTNFINSIIRNFSRLDIESTSRKEYTSRMLELAGRYVSANQGVEHSFVAMEILFSLVDNEVLSREQIDYMMILRQDILTLVQDFESEFNPSNASDVNRDLLRRYRQSIADTNETIRQLIEKLMSEAR